ncbi:sensor histidine kinase [Halalkalibacter flavus]|uniref:sensor histidine kinase n=1 Tax=Halalkalibacter flavus TaxID=3090668 RepID=UPI002FC7E519
MFFIFFFNTLFAIILFITQPKENEANRWMITFCMSAAIGALSESILTDIIPVVEKIGVNLLSPFLFDVHIYFQFLSQVVSPYAILMYSIVYSKIIKVSNKKKLQYILAIPMVVMVFFADFQPDIAINFRVLLMWSAPYILIASYIMFYTYYTEINMYQKQSKFRVFIVLVPAWLGVFIFNYVFRAIDIHTELFRLVPTFFFIAYLLFVLYIFLHGAFGMKVKIEQQQILDKSMQIMSGGTAILNHTIKNEVSKIKFFFNIAKDSIEKKDLNEAKNSIESVFPAIEGIDNMVDRIRSKTEEIVLKETSVQLEELIRGCIDKVQPIFNSKGLEIKTHFKADVTLYCDDVLLAEVINNILNNAMESIVVPNGQIHVQLSKIKNGLSIEVSDNGVGIPKEELKRIMEPFFSTKKNIKNHGLGLSFCYKAIRAHGGEIFVHSEVNKGTSVIIQLPKSRIV